MSVRTDNDFAFGSRTGEIAPLVRPVITTRQQAYRTIAWLEFMAEVNTLPDETPASTLDEVREAIRNT